MSRVFWTTLCVAVFACLFSFPVRANEPRVGNGLVCDTKEQVALFAATVEAKGVHGAIAAVNQDVGDPFACLIAQVLFVVVEKTEVVKIGGNNFVITKILVGGIVTPAGMEPVPPKEFYTILAAPADHPA